jgi:hypothetical protein
MWKRIPTSILQPKCPWCGRTARLVNYAGVTEINTCSGCNKFFGIMEVIPDPVPDDVFDAADDSKDEGRKVKNVKK